MLSSNGALLVFEPKDNNDTQYLVPYYIEDLDCYLIVVNNAEILNEIILTQRIKTAIAFLTAFLIVAVLVITIAPHYHKKI